MKKYLKYTRFKDKIILYNIMSTSTNTNQSNNGKKHATQNMGPHIRNASVVQLLSSFLEKYNGICKEVEVSNQIGHPNRLYEQLVAAVTTPVNGTTILACVQNLLRFTNQDLHPAVWFHLFRWDENSKTEMPSKAYKYLKEADAEGFLVNNPNFDNEFARFYFSPSLGDGCRLEPSYLNNVLRALSRKLQSLYEHVLFPGVKPTERSVTNFKLRERVTDPDTGRTYFREFVHHNDILQVMTLVTLVTQLINATQSIDFRQLSETLTSLARTKDEQTAYVEARKQFARAQKELGRETTMSSISTPELQEQLEKVQQLPMRAPRKAPAVSVWTAKAAAQTTTPVVEQTQSTVETPEQTTQPSSSTTADNEWQTVSSEPRQRRTQRK